jgi:hypothetical protein
LETYQSLVLNKNEANFHPIKSKLHEIAARELQLGDAGIQGTTYVAGEGNPGLIRRDEPEVIQNLRARMRILHAPKNTEDTYAYQIKKFIRHLMRNLCNVFDVTKRDGPVTPGALRDLGLWNLTPAA